MTLNDTEIDETTLESSPQKSQILRTLTTGPFSSSISNLSTSSRAIPSDKDFHFFYNFDEFKLPIQEIAVKSQSLLESIGSSSSNQIFSQKLQFPTDADIDEAYDWLVNVNDEIFERFDSSIDEFTKIREETSGAVGMGTEDGFQLVNGKRNKKQQGSVKTSASGDLVGGDSGVKVADNKKGVLGNKAKVPFHIPTIRRSQEEFNILVNNSNRAFEHVWLERSEDDSRVIHPLEKLSVLDFVDKSAGDVEPALPLLIERTPFKLVEEVKDLKELAAKLRSASEFAVDLEHNQYRSFQGLTCLMQVSTRTEDFIVDTLKLRIHVGPYLREVFKDPSKKKVMHGADRDIVWLQRDFGIYVCNMFDTGQASRVLKLERNSLEYLLHHFCGVAAKKEYQNADWRLRPLPDEMLRYAREDTHYLLHIYDLMRAMLLSMPNDDGNADPPLLQVYKRSYDVCMQLYEKELFTENSYLHIYGLHTAGFSAQQLAIVAGLYEWRDAIARAEDESTGYILPNKTLIEIAKEMPVTTSKLRRLLKSKHPYVERNLSSVVSIIRHSMQTSAAFEAAVQYLKERQMETKALQEDVEANDGGEAFSSLSVTSSEAANTEAKSTPAGIGMNGTVGAQHEASAQLVGPVKQGSSLSELSRGGQGSSDKHNGEDGGVKKESSSYISDTSPAAKVTGATVQALRKPSSGFAALLGSAATKKKLDTNKKVTEEIKLEKIRSSTNLSVHSFTGGNEPPKVPKQVAEEPIGVSEISNPKESLDSVASDSRLEEIMIFGDDSDIEETIQIEESDKTTNADKDDKSSVSFLETDKEIPVSLSDLSTSFQKCFQSNNQNRKAVVDKSQEPSGLLQVKPFDYAAARKQVNFTGDAATELEAGDGQNQRGLLDSAGKITGSRGARVLKDDGTGEFKEGRRRQAFPATGNRSGTFR